MAINTGKGHRTGVVSDRTQVFNPKTSKYVKRDAQTGQFLACKDSPFKNIRNEEVIKKNKTKNKTKNKKTVN